MTIMRLGFNAFCVLLLLPKGTHGAPLLVDSFDDGFFAFSHDASSGRSEQQFGAMIGGDRIVSLYTERLAPPVNAAVDPNSSQIAFAGLGQLVLSYGGDRDRFAEDPLDLDLRGFTAVEIDVESLVGAGHVSVVVNSRAFGSPFRRLPLESAGPFRYPVSEMNGGDLTDVDSLHIWVLGSASDFAVNLSAVRLVPEPSAMALLPAGSLLLLAARRSTRCGPSAPSVQGA